MFKKTVVLIILSILLVSCNSKTQGLIFKGKNGDWSGIIELEDLTGDGLIKLNNFQNKYEGNLTLKYKGQDIDSIKDLRYQIDFKNYTINAENIHLNDEGEVIGRVSCSNCEFAKGISEIEINIHWNDQSESFILK